MRHRLFHDSRTAISGAGLLLGPLLGILVWYIMPESYLGDQGRTLLPESADEAAGIAIWMAVWWLTEAIHISATALLPLFLFPISGALSMEDTASSYGDDLIFLFLGGFVLSLSMQRWGLHRRIALEALKFTGETSGGIIGGIMLITAVLSMWVSNTATVVMMLPIAASIVDRMSEELESNAGTSNLRIATLLAIAYGASIGGIGTLIGSPPNLLAASFLEESFGLEISFVGWMAIGLPLVAVFLPIAWFLLVRRLYRPEIDRVPGLPAYARTELGGMGPLSAGERATFIVFVSAVLLWLSRPLLVQVQVNGATPLDGLTDAGIAILASVVLFAWPVDIRRREFVMAWSEMKELPWGILILFGGGLALASAISQNDLAIFIGNALGGLADIPLLLALAVVLGTIIFLTELTSNTATTAAFLPVLAGLAPVIGLAPSQLIIPAAIAASCAFMMPVATPPNALVFASGHLEIRQMARAGLWLNLIAIFLVTLLSTFLR